MNRYYDILKTRFSYKLNGRILARIGTIPKAISNIRLCNLTNDILHCFATQGRLDAGINFLQNSQKVFVFAAVFFSNK